LPHGKSLDVRTASTRAIEQAAKTIRQATRAAKPRRGRTTTADERALAAAAQRALRAAGLARAIVVAVATKPGEVSDLRIQHVPADRLSHLARALAALAKKLS
ncbi:MAG TPA: hypothetical protein VIF62_28830, partial [Labilithrix sp.]